jgi:hypothetical protein
MHAPSRSVRRSVLAAGLAAGFVAVAADPGAGAEVGGGFFAAAGDARVSVVKGARGTTLLNLRLDIDGDPEDASGDGSVLAYDAAGQFVEATLPASWTTGRGASFRVTLAPEAFAPFAATLVGRVGGGEVSVEIASAGIKGRLSRDGETVRLSVSARGTATAGGGTPRKLKIAARLR